MEGQCGNTASFHPLGSRYVEPVIVGNFDEPAAVLVLGAGLAAFADEMQSVVTRCSLSLDGEQSAVRRHCYDLDEEPQNVDVRRPYALGEERRSVAEQHLCALEAGLLSVAVRRQCDLVEVQQTVGELH
jgi:hypothetical protein